MTRQFTDEQVSHALQLRQEGIHWKVVERLIGEGIHRAVKNLRSRKIKSNTCQSCQGENHGNRIICLSCGMPTPHGLMKHVPEIKPGSMHHKESKFDHDGITIRGIKRAIRIPIEHVAYFSFSDRYTNVHTIQGDEHLSQTPLRAIDEYYGGLFTRVSRSSLVRTNKSSAGAA